MAQKNESARETLLRLGDTSEDDAGDSPLEQAEATFQVMAERLDRQKTSLDRATTTILVALDECTCGGVHRALDKAVSDAEGK